MTSKEAAARLDLSEQRIRQLLASGQLTGRRVKKVVTWTIWEIDGASVSAFKRRKRRGPGRPPAS